jgi:hypothetical protein
MLGTGRVRGNLTNQVLRRGEATNGVFDWVVMRIFVHTLLQAAEIAVAN